MKAVCNRKHQGLWFLIEIALACCFFPKLLLAVPVDPLPSDNLIQNPWFRSEAYPTKPGLDQWTDVAGLNALWSTSQKDSNPSPDEVTGTSARFADGSGQGGGTGQGGVDAYLIQVVQADPRFNHLVFQTHWVTGYIEQATITIYGGNSNTGPWNSIWIPLSLTQATSSNHVWTQTDLLTRAISSGFSHYQIEIQARYPADRNQGAKFTGIYLSVQEGSPKEEWQLPEPVISEEFFFGDDSFQVEDFEVESEESFHSIEDASIPDTTAPNDYAELTDNHELKSEATGCGCVSGLDDQADIWFAWLWMMVFLFRKVRLGLF